MIKMTIAANSKYTHQLNEILNNSPLYLSTDKLPVVLYENKFLVFYLNAYKQMTKIIMQ